MMYAKCDNAHSCYQLQPRGSCAQLHDSSGLLEHFDADLTCLFV